MHKGSRCWRDPRAGRAAYSHAHINHNRLTGRPTHEPRRHNARPQSAGGLRSFVVAGDRIFASFSDSRKVFLDGQPIAYEVVELVAEAVRKDRVVDGLVARF